MRRVTISTFMRNDFLIYCPFRILNRVKKYSYTQIIKVYYCKDSRGQIFIKLILINNKKKRKVECFFKNKENYLKTLKFLQTKDVIIELKWSEKNEENDIWKKIEQAQLDLN